ncbi:hypothetical protein N0V82_005711 [Gnomoniopsis sp. IMI 355080]|nr:hypothetical protein N0V82_005711 [Gnomoniopsis sp. IMI 355080]
MDTHDIAIIGGGPADLTAVATLARQPHTVIVFDSNKYRNDKAAGMHMVPGHEGKDLSQFRSESREAILSHYSTISFRDVPVQKIEKKSDTHFTITDPYGQEWHFRKIILAIGSSKYSQASKAMAPFGEIASSDACLAVPPVPGLPVDMLVGLVIHGATNASQLCESVILYTHGDEALAAALKASTNSQDKWMVDSRLIKRLVKSDEKSQAVIVVFEDGTKSEEKFLVSQPLTVPSGQFVQQLGLATTPMGDIQAETPYHQTSVRGVFAAGDCMTPYKVIPGAISSGCNAVVGASTQLQAELHGFPSPVWGF